MKTALAYIIVYGLGALAIAGCLCAVWLIVRMGPVMVVGVALLGAVLALPWALEQRHG